MEINEIISRITVKDWERAFTVEDSRIDAMFKAIKDENKKIGRMAALVLTYANKYRSEPCGWWHKVNEAKALFTENSYEELIKMNMLDIASFKKSVFYDKAVEINNQREEKRIAEINARQRANRIEEAVKMALKVMSNYGRFCMSSHSNWNSFGGRIGQYSHYWTNSNGNRMSDSATRNSLDKYKFDGKHFCRVSWDGGYSYEYSVNYNGGEEYTDNIIKAIKDNLDYASEHSVTIYAYPRLTTKLVKEIKNVLTEIENIADDEINETLNRINVYGVEIK